MSAAAGSISGSGNRLERGLAAVTHLSAAAIVFAVLVRLLSTHARFPWWELDPSRQIVPETALLPSQALMLDLVVWVAAIVGVGACVMMGRPLRWVTGIFAAVGAAGAMTTYILMGARAGSGPDDAVLGSAWSSAIIGAWAMSHLAGDAAIRRQVFVVMAGAAWVLAAKGAYQVFVEHPAMVAHYKANTESMLAAQGIEPGSAGAREFERRLMQPEATGWVGMSNAHASVLAAMLAMTAALAWSAWADVRAKRVASGIAGVLTLGAVAAMGGLVMTFSKGGLGAGALAVAVMLAVLWVARRSPAGGQPESPDQIETAQKPEKHTTRRTLLIGTIAVGLPVLAIVAIFVRGQLGESLGERSLLFRSQYLEGASGVIAESFPWGVGPGGFKAAYALHKLVFSPESVESPHSVLFDWVACLGMLGLAWCALLFVWLVVACASLTGWTMDDQVRRLIRWGHPGVRSLTRMPGGSGSLEEHAHASVSMPPVNLATAAWILVPIGTCAFGWSREAPTVAPDEWLVRALAVGAWVATMFAAAKVSPSRAVPAAVFAAAVALATHAQIELTPVLPATAATVFLLIGLAAARDSRKSGLRASDRPLFLRWCLVLPLVLLLPLALGTARVWDRAAAWERHLAAAAKDVVPLARIRAILAEASDSPESRRELGVLLLPFTPTDARLETPVLIAGAMTACAEHADSHLRSAWESRPEMQRVDDAALRVMLGVAVDLQSMGQADRARALARTAAARIEWMDRRPYNWSRRGGGAAAVASALQAIEQIDPSPDGHRLTRAAELWEKAVELDPTAMSPVLRLIDLYEALGRQSDASKAARRALELNQNLRLDPLKQLSAAQVARLERLAGWSAEPQTAPASRP